MSRLHRLAATSAIAILVFGLVASFAAAQSVFGERLGFVPRNNGNQTNITGTGWVRATLNGSTLVVEGQFANLSSAVTAAHVHFAPLGQKGPVVFPLLVEKSEDGRSGTVSGTFELSAVQLAELRASNLYINVHSELSPGGEVRAWLVPNE